MSQTYTQVKVNCTDAQSRALLEELKINCRNGWYFDGYSFDDKTLMTYKFFLCDLKDRQEIKGAHYVRYYGWVEVTESEDSVVVQAAGALQSMIDPEYRDLLLERFYNDMLQPVCQRQKLIVSK